MLYDICPETFSFCDTRHVVSDVAVFLEEKALSHVQLHT